MGRTPWASKGMMESQREAEKGPTGNRGVVSLRSQPVWGLFHRSFVYPLGVSKATTGLTKYTYIRITQGPLTDPINSYEAHVPKKHEHAEDSTNNSDTYTNSDCTHSTTPAKKIFLEDLTLTDRRYLEDCYF